jgi:hypothetical protein
MRRLVKAVVVASAVALSACYHAAVETGRTAGSTTVTKPFQPGWLWGLVPPPVLNVASQCPTGAARVETVHSFLEGLVGAITFGIFTPMTLQAACATGGSSMLPGERVIDVANGSGAAGTEAAFAEAARRATESGEAVYVRF